MKRSNNVGSNLSSKKCPRLEIPYMSSRIAGKPVSELPKILEKPDLSKALHQLIQKYVFALCLLGYDKSFTNISRMIDCSISALSKVLANPLLTPELQLSLNRAARRAIKSALRKNPEAEISLIIDATVIKRTNKNGRNVGTYHSANGLTLGHRFTNIGLLIGKEYIPIGVIPHYTREYCKTKRWQYRTEGKQVLAWLKKCLPEFRRFISTEFRVKTPSFLFLLDSGYDNSKIQKQIIKQGDHFVMMIKKGRNLEDTAACKVFKGNRGGPWKTVCVETQVGKKKKRRKYRTRTINRIKLNQVGYVQLISSEKASGRGKNTRRYIVSSNLQYSTQEILRLYSKRWAIETWHRTVKQDYGINDCSGKNFISILNHYLLCIIAYLLHRENRSALPAIGTKITDFVAYKTSLKNRSIESKISGKEEIREVIKKMKDEIFKKAS